MSVPASFTIRAFSNYPRARASVNGCARNLAGEDVSSGLSYYNEQYPVTYRLWFETLYKDKYYYMGDAELMAAALLLDVGMYFIGLVIPVYKDPEREFLRLPFEGTPGR